MDRSAAQPDVPQDRDNGPAAALVDGRMHLLREAMAAVLRADAVERPLEIARGILASPDPAATPPRGSAGLAGRDDVLGSPAAVDAATVLVLAGEHEEARGPLEVVVATARTSDDVALLVSALLVRSAVLRSDGDLVAAFADATEADALARSAHLAASGRLATALVVHGRVVRGEVDEAEQHLVATGLDGPLPDDHTAALVLLQRSRLRAAQDRPAAAIADLQEAGRRLTASRIENPAYAPWRSELGLLLHASGDERGARRVVSEELRTARMVGVARPISVAVLAAATITPSPARLARVRHAVVLADFAADPPTRARARVVLGAELLRDEEIDEARQTLQEAVDLATDCGATAQAVEARAALRAAGGPPLRDVLRGPADLTDAELRAAHLAAEGLPTAVIADHLAVVPTTVEGHLAAAVRKLGVATRADLAGALAVVASFGDRFIL